MQYKNPIANPIFHLNSWRDVYGVNGIAGRDQAIYPQSVIFYTYKITFARIREMGPLYCKDLQILETRANEIHTHRIKQCNIRISQNLSQHCTHPVLYLVLLHGYYLDDDTTNILANLLCSDGACSKTSLAAKRQFLSFSIEDV